MSKKLILIIVIAVLAVGGIAFAALNKGEMKNETANVETTETVETQTEAAPSLESSVAQAIPGSYVDYSSDIVASTSGTKLLFFHAPWCPQCRALEASIKKEGVPNGVTIFKVDYDTNQELRKKYGVTIQTTVVKIDDNGNLVEKYVAYEEPSIDSVKNNLL